jgi:type II secretory pathway component GspD/PulD (secretin)
MVSVRYTGRPQGNSTDLGVGGTITNSGSQINVHAGTTTRTAVDSSVSSVRVLEGNGAHIANGQSVPVVTAVLWPVRSRQQLGVGGVATDYRELTSGFDVLPRVNGDRVMLDIATQQERPTNTGQATSVMHRATTTVAGRLGEWIELGGVTSSISEHSTSVGLTGGARSVTTQSDQRTVAVKVEQLE